jgi:molybdopterin molybdotransferase
MKEEFLAQQNIISYRDALTILQTRSRSALLTTETVPLRESLGRILAEDVVTREELPTFANSAMDGFAVRAAQTTGASAENPLHLPILGSLAAGDTPLASDERIGAWEIMTGAPFPPGFDACVKIEDCVVTPGVVEIRGPARPGLNRREIGEDFRREQVLMKVGQKIRAEDILCLASIGILTLTLHRRPRVGIISTGKELVPLEEIPAPGKIRNSSGVFLMAALKVRGCEPMHLGTIPDDPEEFKALVRKTESQDFDLILTTGAISMGKYDFVAGALRELGTEFFFQKVAMRPGKPVLFGRLRGGSFLIGLPGNPISSAVGLRFFVDPFLRELQGRGPELPLRLPLAKGTFKAPNVTCFYKGAITNGPRGSEVILHPEQRPSLMHPLLASDLWVALPEGGEEVAAGTWVDVYNFSDQESR